MIKYIYIYYKIYLNLYIFKTFFLQKNSNKKVICLYFSKKIYEIKFKTNSKIIIIYCSYKSNNYCLPFLNLIKTIY